MVFYFTFISFFSLFLSHHLHKPNLPLQISKTIIQNILLATAVSKTGVAAGSSALTTIPNNIKTLCVAATIGCYTLAKDNACESDFTT